MKILITGITGFVGGHLAERLAAAGGHTLAGVGRAAWPAGLGHLAGAAEL
ncbi:MAG TPA: NAD-dependent epimerase/dehydratase family protein, partial [Urbifossiella sp.]|nr:NAD-dependent epimerase/dehydratase family protein [Urbifossiella sp.]